MRSPLLKCLVVVAISITASGLAPADWPQWRGPNRDGLVKGVTNPATWPKTLKEEWKITVGLGHASPVEANGKIYVFARQGEAEVLLCLDAVSGKEIWKSVPQPIAYEMHEAAKGHGKAQSRHRSLATASFTPSAFPASSQPMTRTPAI